MKGIRNLSNEPLKHHVEQFQLYLAGYGLKRGFLIYLEKSFLKNSIFPADFSLETFRRLLNRAALLHKHLVNNPLPEPDSEKGKCQFCEFKNERDGEYEAAIS